jgi:DNA-directed RNA polymerase specialized sigma24 family protein
MTPYKFDAMELDSIAREISARYKKLAPWTNFDDLRQTAWVAIMLAARTFNQEMGAFTTYAGRAIVLCLSRESWKLHAPVSEAVHRLHTLRDARTVGIDDESESRPFVAPEPSPEKQIGEQAWLFRVRGQLSALLDPVDAKLALPILTGEKKSADVAREHDLPVKEVYRITERARKRIMFDPVLYKLWMEQE